MQLNIIIIKPRMYYHLLPCLMMTVHSCCSLCSHLIPFLIEPLPNCRRRPRRYPSFRWVHCGNRGDVLNSSSLLHSFVLLLNKNPLSRQTLGVAPSLTLLLNCVHRVFVLVAVLSCLFCVHNPGCFSLQFNLSGRKASS